MKNYLSSPRVTDFITGETDPSSALSKVYKDIQKLSRQVPPSNRGDAHRVEYLRRAILGQNWARESLTRVVTNALTFQQLYGELEAAVQLDKDSRLASSVERAKARASEPNIALPIHFTGQGGYRRSNASNRNKPKRSFDQLSIMGCFNCNDPGHHTNKCPKPPDHARAAGNKLTYLRKKGTPNAVHVVLAHFWAQMDGDDTSNEVDTETNDVDIFIDIVENGTAAIHVSHVVINDQSKANSNDEIDIFAVNIPPPKYEGMHFIGGCIDSGAQKTVIGVQQAAAYGQLAGINLTDPNDSSLQFKFGNKTYRGHGTINNRLPISEEHYVDIRAHIVDVDIPLLIGLDVLTHIRATIDFADDVLSSQDGQWSLNLRRKMGHLYVTWDDEVCFSEADVRRLHRHFYHPSDMKLMALIERATPEEANTETGFAVIRSGMRVQSANATLRNHPGSDYSCLTTTVYFIEQLPWISVDQ